MNLLLKPLVSAEAENINARYKTTIRSAGHIIVADEPEDIEGTDSGMNPYSLLLASLGSCTAITLRMYIDRKQWAIEDVLVNMDIYKTETGTLINRKITFKGVVSAAQHERLLAIANACPIHKILTGNIEIVTS